MVYVCVCLRGAYADCLVSTKIRTFKIMLKKQSFTYAVQAKQQLCSFEANKTYRTPCTPNTVQQNAVRKLQGKGPGS